MEKLRLGLVNTLHGRWGKGCSWWGREAKAASGAVRGRDRTSLVSFQL